MRYYTRDHTLFIRGRFTAASSGPGGGYGSVPTVLLVCRVPSYVPEIGRALELAISGEGLSKQYFGLLSSCRLRDLIIVQYDYITLFLIGGVVTSPGSRGESPGIIVHSSEGLSGAALIGAVATVSKVVTGISRERNLPLEGDSDTSLIVMTEGEVKHDEAGILTGPGERIQECLRFGMPLAERQNNPRTRPLLYVFSRFGGGHFVEWTPEDCPYYPCHFEGQRCDYCYCPFYPCGDETLGQWSQSSSGGNVWNCSGCTLLHKPAVAVYLKENPDASLRELKKIE
jgi:adenosylcobinamide hydrolase